MSWSIAELVIQIDAQHIEATFNKLLSLKSWPTVYIYTVYIYIDSFLDHTGPTSLRLEICYNFFGSRGFHHNAIYLFIVYPSD